VYPTPIQAETLSSWIEGTACFYSCDFDHWIAPILFELEQSGGGTIDLDANESLRNLLSKWTGLSLPRIPTSCASHESGLLPRPARLAFCESCWDEDIHSGKQPYVRQTWTYWATVHCSVHRAFLSAKFTNLDKRDEYVSWQDVWAAKSGWRCALDLQKRAKYSGAGWYEPIKADRWSARLRDQTFDALSKFECPGDCAATEALDDAKLTFALSGAPLSPRGRVARMSGSAFSATSGPFLLENRIQVLRLAVEILGLLHGPL
jgi:hypothetical protein